MSRRPPPAWVGETDRTLFGAFKRVSLLGHLGPTNFMAEVRRLVAAFERGEPSAPRFQYAPAVEVGTLRAPLEALAIRLDEEGELGAIYAARARELSVEAELVLRRGTGALAEIAAQRYAGGEHDAAADALAEALSTGVDAHDDEPADILSDDAGDPRSLLVQMQREVGTRRLPVRVVVRPSLAALAAVGDGTVQIAAGRRLRARDVERTVLHEVVGHLEPAHRARRASLSVFRFGTARGSDDQEGYALLTERRAGHLSGARGRELAARHVAARRAHAGAAFEDVVAELLGRGVAVGTAVLAACRAFRGGGLGREVAYLVSLVRVERSLSGAPSLERVISAGRVSAAAASALEPWAVTKESSDGERHDDERGRPDGARRHE